MIDRCSETASIGATRRTTMCPQRCIAIALVTAAVISTTASAQQPRPAEQHVLATDDQRMDALRRGDPTPLDRIYADDDTLVTGTGQIRTKADQLAELKTGQLRYQQIEAVERQVRMYGDVVIPNKAEGQRVASR